MGWAIFLSKTAKPAKLGITRAYLQAQQGSPSHASHTPDSHPAVLFTVFKVMSHFSKECKSRSRARNWSRTSLHARTSSPHHSRHQLGQNLLPNPIQWRLQQGEHAYLGGCIPCHLFCSPFPIFPPKNRWMT